MEARGKKLFTGTITFKMCDFKEISSKQQHFAMGSKAYKIVNSHMPLDSRPGDRKHMTFPSVSLVSCGASSGCETLRAPQFQISRRVWPSPQALVCSQVMLYYHLSQ